MDQQAFWHMTLGEIKQYIKVHNENDKAEFKHQLLLREFQAARTAEYVSTIFSKDAKVGSYFEKFPSLFEEGLEDQEESEMQANIARAKQFAEYHNQKYEQEGGENYG